VHRERFVYFPVLQIGGDYKKCYKSTWHTMQVFLDGRRIQGSAHLKMMKEGLPTHQILRAGRPFIVALGKISALQGKVVEIRRPDIPVGTTYKEELLKRSKLD
jgi:hypothetical protein